GKLIDVRVWYAEPRILRPQVRHLRVPIRSDRFLNREVPLLRIARPVVAIHAKDTLPQTRVRIRRRHLNRGPVRQAESGVHVVLRLLTDGLNEWKLRDRKGRRDAGLLKENHAVAGANHPAIANSIRQSHART